MIGLWRLLKRWLGFKGESDQMKIRCDLEDVIYDINPTETPFMERYKDGCTEEK